MFNNHCSMSNGAPKVNINYRLPLRESNSSRPTRLATTRFRFPAPTTNAPVGVKSINDNQLVIAGASRFNMNQSKVSEENKQKLETPSTIVPDVKQFNCDHLKSLENKVENRVGVNQLNPKKEIKQECEVLSTNAIAAKRLGDNQLAREEYRRNDIQLDQKKELKPEYEMPSSSGVAVKNLGGNQLTREEYRRNDIQLDQIKELKQEYEMPSNSGVAAKSFGDNQLTREEYRRNNIQLDQKKGLEQEYGMPSSSGVAVKHLGGNQLAREEYHRNDIQLDQMKELKQEYEMPSSSGVAAKSFGDNQLAREEYRRNDIQLGQKKELKEEYEMPSSSGVAVKRCGDYQLEPLKVRDGNRIDGELDQRKGRTERSILGPKFNPNAVDYAVASSKFKFHADFSGKHPLGHKWAWWYLEVDRTKSWEDMQNLLTSFNTVEDFWSTFNHLKLPSEMKYFTDYSIFKHNIRPMWEDPVNKHGGRWIFALQRYMLGHINFLWLNIILLLIGETFHDDQMCGVVVNKRHKISKVSVWVKDGKNEEIVMSIGKKLKKIFQSKYDLQFYLHEDAAALGVLRKPTHVL